MLRPAPHNGSFAMSSSFPEAPQFPAGLWRQFGFSSPVTVEGPFWGLSGAPTWKVGSASQFWAIKRLRPDQIDWTWREATHALLRQLSSQDHLPVPFPRGVSLQGGWAWECLSWLPGQPLSAADSPEFFVRTAAPILGQIHRATAAIRSGYWGSLKESGCFAQRVKVLEGPGRPLAPRRNEQATA